MYALLLATHNIIRWVALILGVIALGRALLGWFGKREWVAADRKIGVYFGSAMDVQLLIGLVLYVFYSPLTKQIFQDFGAAMGSADLRFFGLEHVFYMFLAVAFAHLGSVFSKKASLPESKFRSAALWFGLAVLLILVGMPWGRPLLRGM